MNWRACPSSPFTKAVSRLLLHMHLALSPATCNLNHCARPGMTSCVAHSPDMSCCLAEGIIANIEPDSVQNAAALSLRVGSILLWSAVIILQRQVAYLKEECEGVLTNLKKVRCKIFLDQAVCKQNMLLASQNTGRWHPLCTVCPTARLMLHDMQASLPIDAAVNKKQSKSRRSKANAKKKEILQEPEENYDDLLGLPEEDAGWDLTDNTNSSSKKDEVLKGLDQYMQLDLNTMLNSQPNDGTQVRNTCCTRCHPPVVLGPPNSAPHLSVMAFVGIQTCALLCLLSYNHRLRLISGIMDIRWCCVCAARPG